MIVTQYASERTNGGNTAATVSAYAKLTLSFRVVGRRDDGYHSIEAEVVTVDFADELVQGSQRKGDCR